MVKSLKNQRKSKKALKSNLIILKKRMRVEVPVARVEVRMTMATLISLVIRVVPDSHRRKAARSHKTDLGGHSLKRLFRTSLTGPRPKMTKGERRRTRAKLRRSEPRNLPIVQKW